MSPAELVYRLHHKQLAIVDACRHTLGISFIDTASTDPDFTPIFALSNHATKDFINRQQISLAQPILVLADQYLDNTWPVFGLKFCYGEQVDWHLDPKTQKRWPQAFWRKIDIRDGFRVGGPKFVWETNRLYCLPILGMAFRLTGNPVYSNKFFALIKDWLTANPYPVGVNWTSGIELGVRLANLVWGISFLEGANFDALSNKAINQFVALHARHLARYPARYSSNNNHALAEALGLFLAGAFFPHLKGSRQWVRSGQQVLDKEVVRQILPDGGSYEYSTTYLSFIFDFFLFYRLACSSLKVSYPPAVDKQLEKSCEFIHALLDNHGNIANIGDQDSAILVNFGLDNHENFSSILNTGAILFNRPEFRRQGFPDFKSAVLLGATAHLASPTGTSSFAKGIRAIHLRDSGLSIIRCDEDGRSFVFTGNATPLGMPPLYAHGHLDALSFTLAINGHEVLVDPGTYLYHSGGKWRRYFRSTAAHNTIRLNGSDLTDQIADFMFGEPYAITEHSLQQTDRTVCWRASHNAYASQGKSVPVAREVVFIDETATFSFVDTLNTNARVEAELFFHLHPDCRTSLDGNSACISINGRPVANIEFDKRMVLSMYSGSEDPLLGWFSPRFNEIAATVTLVGRATFASPSAIRTTVSLFPSL